jgi:hypothetical protein
MPIDETNDDSVVDMLLIVVVDESAKYPDAIRVDSCENTP